LSSVTESTREVLAGLSAGRPEALKEVVGSPDQFREAAGLDERTFALVRLAALISLDAPPSSYACQVATAIEAGVSSDEIVGVLYAVGPQIGEPKVVAAAPELMLALGLSLPDAGEYPKDRD
jgi:alkylhydroperoxidase/carboxymuconolactone decarboxylase family protein YurZ